MTTISFLYLDKVLSLKVTFDEYYESLVDHCHMKMSCMCKVKETKHTFVDQDTFRLVKPEITIKVRGQRSFLQKMPCLYKVVETKHTYVDQDSSRLVKPEITIKVRLRGQTNPILSDHQILT